MLLLTSWKKSCKSCKYLDKSKQILINLRKTKAFHKTLKESSLNFVSNIK